MSPRIADGQERDNDQFYTPSFQSEVKESILTVIASIIAAEEDFLTHSNEGKYEENYKDFRKNFRFCFLLTKKRMDDNNLISKCNTYFSQQLPNGKDERTALAKTGLNLAGQWIDLLSEEGVIDFYGGSVRKYNFAECEELLKLADGPDMSEEDEDEV